MLKRIKPSVNHSRCVWELLCDTPLKSDSHWGLAARMRQSGQPLTVLGEVTTGWGPQLCHFRNSVLFVFRVY